MNVTSKNLLFENYNFVLHTQDDSCTLNALEIHLFFGSAFKLQRETLHMCVSAYFQVVTSRSLKKNLNAV